MLDRVRVLLRRRIATVVAADKDSGAFDTLDRFELAESVKGKFSLLVCFPVLVQVEAKFFLYVSI